MFVQNAETISQLAHEQIIVLVAPLLENNHPTQEICDFFSKVSIRARVQCISMDNLFHHFLDIRKFMPNKVMRNLPMVM